MIRIVIDAMGGDYAPDEQVKGSILALNQNPDMSLILVGDELQINAVLQTLSYDKSRVEVRHTTEVIGMEEIPTKAVKTKKDSSLVVACSLLKEDKADALVCSASTGAVLTAGVLKIGRLKGVSRPALCPLIPNLKGTGTLLCDCGANLECKPINLVHFGIMASAYAQATYGIENPVCGLLNNGTEDHKGDEVHQEAHAMLKKTACINYKGNIEGRDIMLGEIDVTIADGYTGNIALKSVEGCGKAVSTIMKKQFKRNFFTKLRYLFVKDIIGNIRKNLDYEKLGGAMFLGLQKTVVKVHGNAKAKGFAICIEQALNAVRGNMLGKMKEMLDKANLELAPPAQESSEGNAQ